MRRDPSHRDRYLLEEGWAYQALGRYEDSITADKGFLALHLDISLAHVGFAVDDIELGHDDAARAEAAEALRLNPQYIWSADLQQSRPEVSVDYKFARPSD